MPAKLFGVLFIVAGLLLRYGVKRARRRGYVGPRYRRIYREADRAKFNFAITAQFAGAMICFVAALLCFTHNVGR